MYTYIYIIIYVYVYIYTAPEATTPPMEHTPNNTPGGGDEGTPLLIPAEDPLIQQLLFQVILYVHM
jgi:hypothetical protein